MARPKAGYYNAAGKRIPGATTICGIAKDSGGLIHWAWDLGMQGLDYREVRDKAADAGTLVHSMIEAHAAGTDPFEALVDVDSDLATLAIKGYDGYKEWAEVSKIEIVDQEMSMVSEEYQFGGTPDAIGYCNGKLSLLDWKSGRLYPEQIIQVASYRQLQRENHPDDVIESVHLCRFNKETGGFVHMMLPEEVVDLGWEQFKLLRVVYENSKLLKKAVK